jgi:hypothetical protein
MSGSWQDDLLGGTVTMKLIRNNHAKPAATGSQELAEEAHRSKEIVF